MVSVKEKVIVSNNLVDAENNGEAFHAMEWKIYPFTKVEGN